MKTIKVFTNIVQYGWSAKQLESGIGGSEEKLIEWARWLANHKDNQNRLMFDVTIYMNGEHGVFDGVKYKDHTEFKPWQEHDIFISFKNRQILEQSINAKQIYHWTTEVEPPAPVHLFKYTDRIIPISQYHENRYKEYVNLPSVKHLPLFIDTAKMNKNKVDKEPDTMLYCSSFDRGLEELLTYWEQTKKKLGVKKLFVTYGWDFMDLVIKNNPALVPWKQRMEALMGVETVVNKCSKCFSEVKTTVRNRDDIEFLGRVSNDKMCELYWRSQYWALPLNNPDSELFCINAIKAQLAEAIPVVRRAGALQNTVNNFINWDDIIENKEIIPLSKKDIIDNKRFANNFKIDKTMSKWLELFA